MEFNGLYPPPNHEARIHNAVFNGLSHAIERSPSSHRYRQIGNMDDDFTNALKISWNHFGTKYIIGLNHLRTNEDLFEILMRKVRLIHPEFSNALAYKNLLGKEVYGYSNIGVLPASDMLSYSGRNTSSSTFHNNATRSASVPPASHASSPTAILVPKSQTQRSTSTVFYPKRNLYVQPMLYGLPPNNALFPHLLMAGSGYHPGVYIVPSFHSQRWIGPNKYRNWNGIGGPYYYKTGWGPVW
ncbi:hypothetical protein DdX_04874 [Ditylenchus destructor]|uniref:Uncharacterized protein n=1 Tax=Ditylenchus destructor TaxID=166010 RepID=A0AAD4N8A7_9BILA|nr:hypothetical protein DdX_04874 [Ditylenchus destructor]